MGCCSYIRIARCICESAVAELLVYVITVFDVVNRFLFTVKCCFDSRRCRGWKHVPLASVSKYRSSDFFAYSERAKFQAKLTVKYAKIFIFRRFVFEPAPGCCAWTHRPSLTLFLHLPSINQSINLFVTTKYISTTITTTYRKLA